MQYEEENISQEELEKEEVVDTDESEAEAEEFPKKPKAKGPKKSGLLLTVFGAILIILIGGLASYYYYTYKLVGKSSEQVLTNVWDETVLVTIRLTDKFETIDSFDALGADGREGFETYVGDANRTVRDGIFDVRSQTGLDITAGSFASKLHSFLDDYSNMLGELKRISSRAEEVESTDELNQLIDYQEDMEASYDELLLVSEDYIQANLPRDIFEMPEDILGLLETKLGEAGETEDEEKSSRQAAEAAVSAFVDAWQGRDPEAMEALMTAGAKNEFNKGILEDSSDITGLRIMNTKATADTSIEINGKLDKETPDGHEVTEDWRFILIKTGDKWLIDTWKKI